MNHKNRIEVATQNSNAWSWQAMICMKGNRRRTYKLASLSRGDIENIYHSFMKMKWRYNLWIPNPYVIACGFYL